MRQRPMSARVGCPEASRLARPMTIFDEERQPDSRCPRSASKTSPGGSPRPPGRWDSSMASASGFQSVLVCLEFVPVPLGSVVQCL